MADATSNNEPVSIIIQTDDATITITPTGKTQEQLQDIVATGINMQLVTDWIAAGYHAKRRPIHELVVEDISDLWLIRTDGDIGTHLTRETMYRTLTPSADWTRYYTGYPTVPSVEPLPNLFSRDFGETSTPERDIPWYEQSRNLPLTTGAHYYHKNPGIGYGRHENLTYPEPREQYEYVVEQVRERLFGNPTSEELAARAVRDAEALGDAMAERGRKLAEGAFEVTPVLPIDEHLDVLVADVSVDIDGGEPPRILGEEIEIDIPSIYGDMGRYVEREPRSRAIGDIERRGRMRGNRRPRRHSE